MNLLELLQQNAPIDEIAKYLEKQLKTSQIKMTKEVNGIDLVSKKSALRLAFEKLDFDKMQLLLDFDAHDVAGNGFSSCEDEARVLLTTMEDKSKKTVLKKILALLHTRRVWNDQQDSFLLNRSMRVIASAHRQIVNLFDAYATLFIGTTGHGKSTLINFLLGIDYRYIGSMLEKVNSLAIETAKVGLTVTSETLYPSGYRYQDGYLVDMAGFEGTRESERLCVAAGMRMFTKPLAGIKKIVFVCSHAVIELDSKLLDYRRTAAKIGRMVLGNPEAINSVVLAVTKKQIGQQDENVMLASIRDKLRNLLNAEDMEGVPAEVDAYSADDPEYLDKIAVRCLTEALLRDDKIIIADVSLPTTRNKFQELLQQARNVATNQYNFSSFDRDMRHFLTMTKNIRKYYAHIKQEIAALSLQCKNLQLLLEGHNQKLQEKKQKLNEHISERDQPFDPAQYDKNIQANNDEQYRLSTVIARILVLQEHLNEKETIQLARVKKVVGRNEAKIAARAIPAYMQLGNEWLTHLTIALKDQTEAIDAAFKEIMAEVNQQLTSVRQQSEICEKRKKPLQENKTQALANYARIKANTPVMIAAVESEIATLQQEMARLAAAINANQDQLENLKNEIAVNEVFLEHINKMFEVLVDQPIVRNEATVVNAGIFAPDLRPVSSENGRNMGMGNM